MTTINYQYINFPNGIDNDFFSLQLTESSLATLLNNISYLASSVEITFTRELTGPETTVLTNLVNNHNPANAPNLNFTSLDGESLGISTTTLTTFQRKLRITATNIPTGIYRINWFYNWYYTGSGTNFVAQIQINDTTTILTHVQEPNDVSTNQRYTVNGYKIVALNLGTYDIDLDYRSSNNSNTAGILNASLEIIRIS